MAKILAEREVLEVWKVVMREMQIHEQRVKMFESQASNSIKL